jgi:hypothetical protein
MKNQLEKERKEKEKKDVLNHFKHDYVPQKHHQKDPSVGDPSIGPVYTEKFV